MIVASKLFMVDRIVQSFLINLGLDSEEIKVYSSLVEKGNQTILDLARHTKIPRTTVYRLLELMKQQGVVEEIVDEYKTKAKAVSPDTLEFLVGRKEVEVQNLKAQLPSVKSALAFVQGQIQPDTKVLFYRGKEGIQQMVWNTLRAKDEVVGYTYRPINEIVGKQFAKKWQEEFELRRLKGRDLFSDEYVHGHTEIPEPEDWKVWPGKYISPKILNIDHQTDIYNDVIGIYNWHHGEVFGVEIYNEKVANFQKQIFEVMWNLASKSSSKQPQYSE